MPLRHRVVLWFFVLVIACSFYNCGSIGHLPAPTPSLAKSVIGCPGGNMPCTGWVDVPLILSTDCSRNEGEKPCGRERVPFARQFFSNFTWPRRCGASVGGNGVARNQKREAQRTFVFLLSNLSILRCHAEHVCSFLRDRPRDAQPSHLGQQRGSFQSQFRRCSAWPTDDPADLLKCFQNQTAIRVFQGQV